MPEKNDKFLLHCIEAPVSIGPSYTPKSESIDIAIKDCYIFHVTNSFKQASLLVRAVNLSSTMKRGQSIHWAAGGSLGEPSWLSRRIADDSGSTYQWSCTE